MVCSRHLPVWSSEFGWSEPQATNHFSWALADLCRADYAGRRPDTHYKLQQLAEFAARADLSAAEFNAYFDTEGVSVWDGLERAGMPGRVRVIDYAGQYWFVRDEKQPAAVQSFGMHNIVAGSFSKTISKFVTESADSVIVKFKDETADYKDHNDGDGLFCKVPESPGVNPKEVVLYGVTNPVESKKIGMWLAASSAYRRDLPTWATGIEGRIPFFGRQVDLSHFLLGQEGRTQISGAVIGFDGVDILELSEPVPDGLAEPSIVLRDFKGRPTAAFKVQVLHFDRVRVLPIDNGGSGIYPDWSQVTTGSSCEEGTKFALGDGPTFMDQVKITRITRNGDQFKLSGFVDDDRVYLLADDVIAPLPYQPAPGQSIVPAVQNLTYSLSGTLADPVILLAWDGVNCDYYEVHISDDGINFEPYGNKVISAQLVVRPGAGSFHFRVYGFNILRGQPATVVVNTTEVATAVPPAPTNLVLRASFTGPKLQVEWQSLTHKHLISVLVGGVEQYYEPYDGTEWDFAATLAQEYGVGRGFTVRVYAVGENSIVSTGYAELAAYNPPPVALNNLSIATLGETAGIRFDQPLDTDFAGVSVWMGDEAGFAIGEASRAITRSFDPVLGVGVGRGVDKYIVVAAEDEWGSDGLSYSGEYHVTGNLIEETEIGPNAIKSPHISANAVEAIHMFVTALSAISADLGTVVAGLFKTAASTSDARVEIGSVGNWPFWIGELTKSAANGHVYYDKVNKLFVFQDPTSGMRLEFQPGGTVPIWIGSGNKSTSNGLMWVDNTGSMRLKAALTADALNAIDTINLKGQAVTIPASSFSAGGTSLSSSYKSVASVVFDTTGAPISIQYSNDAYNGQQESYRQFRLKVNGSVQFETGKHGWAVVTNPINMTDTFDCFTFPYVHGSAQQITVSIEAKCPYGGSVKNRALECEERKV